MKALLLICLVLAGCGKTSVMPTIDSQYLTKCAEAPTLEGKDGKSVTVWATEVGYLYSNCKIIHNDLVDVLLKLQPK